MDFNPFPQLEAALYRRNDEQPSSPLECHNHILQGSYLRYIKRSLRPKDIGRYRLVLVQGTLRGRLQSIRLHPGSSVTAITTANEANEMSKFEIHLTGTDDCKIRTILGSQEVKWQISFPSEEVQQKWLISLKYACDFAGNWPKKEEIDRLKDLARKMRSNVDARMRFHRFKLIPRCFIGQRAIKWIMKYEGCSVSDATIVGQKMLNLGLFQHITNEHVFCNKKLLYQFPNSFDHISSIRKMGLFPHLQNSVPAQPPVISSNAEKQDTDKIDCIFPEILSMSSEKLAQLLSFENDEDRMMIHYKITSTPIIYIFIILYRSGLTRQQSRALCGSFEPVDSKVIATSVAISGSMIMKNGFYGFFLYGENRHLNGSQRDSIKSVVDNMSAALQSSKSEDRTISLESLYPFPDTEYDDEESDLEGDEEEDEEEDEGEGEDEEGDDNSDEDKEGDDDDEDEVECDDDDCYLERDEGEKAGISLLSSPPSVAPGNIVKPLLWPNYPLLLKRSRSMLPSGLTPQEVKRLCAPLHIHQPGEPEISEFPIESDLFIGKAFIIVADLQDSPHSYFKRKERKFEAVFQGRFKRAVPYANVYSGQVYDKPMTHIPGKLLVNTALKIMAKLQPAVQIYLSGNQPYFLSPLASTAQKIIISRPGDEPSISYGIDSLEENMTLLDPFFAKMTSHKRKSFFIKRENLLDFVFDPKFVYTFDFYQHRMNLATFKVNLGLVQYDIQKMLIGRPIQLMAVEWIPQNQILNPKNQNQSQNRGEVFLGKTPEKGMENKNSEFESQKEKEEFKFLYNIEIWHKGCVSKNIKTINNVPGKMKNISKKLEKSTSKSSKLSEVSPNISVKKVPIEESQSDRKSILFTNPIMFLDIRSRSKSQSSSFSSISTPPLSNSKEDMISHHFENSDLIGSPQRGSRPCSAGQKRSASIDMSLRALNIFHSNNQNNNNNNNNKNSNEGYVTPHIGTGSSSFVGTIDTPGTHTPVKSSPMGTPRISQKTQIRSTLIRQI